MKFLMKFVLVILLIQFTNCTYAQKGKTVQKGDERPQWIEHPYSLYSERQYLVGVGSGDTREAAEKNAVAQIAKIFKTDIRVDETLIESVLESTKGKKSELSTSSEIYNRTRIKSDQQLKNVKIDQVYFSEKDGMYYALAYLDRVETSALYEQDFKENDRLMLEYFQKSQNETNKLHRLSDINKSIALFEINRLINEQYKVLTGGNVLTPSVSKSELDQALRSVREKISVSLAAGSDTPQEVGDYLREIIGNIGFKIVEQNADFVINYELQTEKSSLNRPGIVALNWHLKIDVVDRVNNFTLKTFNMNKRTAAISEGEAKAKILRTVKENLKTKFYRQLMDYLNSF